MSVIQLAVIDVPLINAIGMTHNAQPPWQLMQELKKCWFKLIIHFPTSWLIWVRRNVCYWCSTLLILLWYQYLLAYNWYYKGKPLVLPVASIVASIFASCQYIATSCPSVTLGGAAAQVWQYFSFWILTCTRFADSLWDHK